MLIVAPVSLRLARAIARFSLKRAEFFCVKVSELDCGSLRPGDEILDPFAALDEIIADAALDDLQRLDAYKHAEYRHCRIA